MTTATSARQQHELEAKARQPGRAATAATTAPSAPLIHFKPVITPRGDGSHVVTARLVVGVDEVGLREAARILGYKSRSSAYEQVLNHPKAHLLKWRYTLGGGKILVERASLLAFKEATKENGR